MAAILRQAEVGVPVVEVCRMVGITEQAFYRWKKKYAAIALSHELAAWCENVAFADPKKARDGGLPWTCWWSLTMPSSWVISKSPQSDQTRPASRYGRSVLAVLTSREYRERAVRG